MPYIDAVLCFCGAVNLASNSPGFYKTRRFILFNKEWKLRMCQPSSWVFMELRVWDKKSSVDKDWGEEWAHFSWHRRGVRLLPDLYFWVDEEHGDLWVSARWAWWSLSVMVRKGWCRPLTIWEEVRGPVWGFQIMDNHLWIWRGENRGRVTWELPFVSASIKRTAILDLAPILELNLPIWGAKEVVSRQPGRHEASWEEARKRASWSEPFHWSGRQPGTVTATYYGVREQWRRKWCPWRSTSYRVYVDFTPTAGNVCGTSFSMKPGQKVRQAIDAFTQSFRA